MNFAQRPHKDVNPPKTDGGNWRSTKTAPKPSWSAAPLSHGGIMSPLLRSPYINELSTNVELHCTISRIVHSLFSPQSVAAGNQEVEGAFTLPTRLLLEIFIQV
jgi:hypothetical protein